MGIAYTSVRYSWMGRNDLCQGILLHYSQNHPILKRVYSSFSKRGGERGEGRGERGGGGGGGGGEGRRRGRRGERGGERRGQEEPIALLTVKSHSSAVFSTMGTTRLS